MFSGIYFVLHAASQLAHRWFDPAEVLFADASLAHPYDLGIDDWMHAIFSLRHARLQRFLHQSSMKEASFLKYLVISIVNHLQIVREHKAHYLTLEDPLYPALLRAIPQPPLAITVVGDAAVLSLPAVAIIGSRKAAERTVREAAVLAMGFADLGYVTVSGGALGCDTAAHWGALQSGYVPTPTIVVFASGLMHRNPQQNTDLFEAICANGGVLLSERLWWQESLARDFPVRNRIITGLARQLYVMQAAERSGAMVTARCALEQNRDIYVLTHDDEDARMLGSRSLLDDGAQPFACAADTLRNFPHNQVHLF